MRVFVTSVLVDDQEKALRFNTDILGFAKNDLPTGDHRWLTVTSPGEPEGTELLLEPSWHPAAAEFKAALAQDGIPYTAFSVVDVDAEYERLIEHGVTFTQPPKTDGDVRTAVFDDTCGNLLQIVQLGGA